MPAYSTAREFQPSPLPDHQERLAARMEHLLGALPAAWFRDAWRLGRADLTHSHRLETSAYVVPLLLGQVEERLRRVLLPDDFVPLSEMDLVKQELDAVAEICGLSAEQKQRWKDVTDRLNIARGEQPFLISLDGLQVDCEQVFGTLLDGLATRYVEVLRKIDRFPQKPSPEALRRLLVKLPDNVLVHDRLLAKLPRESRYLEALNHAGFFRAPPPPDRDAQGNIQFHRPWRAAEFLAQVASESTLHDAVWVIMEGLPDTDNESVHSSLAKAAMELPVQLAAQWACREVAWLEARAVRNRIYDHSTEQLGALAAYLAQRGAVTESLSLFRALLKYPPRPRSTDGTIPGSPDTPPDEHSAAHVLRKHLPSLIQHAGISLMPVLDMLSDVIDSIEEWHAGSDDGARTYLSFERKAIDPHTDRVRQYRSVLYDLLIDQTVAVAEKAAQTDSLLATVERLEQRRSVLLHRTALYLLSRFPERADILIRARLVDAKQYQERRLDPEYKDLLGTHFRLLPRADQQTILGWISKGPQDFYFAEMRTRWGTFESESYVRSWTYRRLQELEPSLSALPDSWQKRYEDLRKEFVSQTPERARVYTADDLLNMDVGAALRLVSTELSPSNDFEQEQQNKTSLRSLQEAISREPSRFAERPGGFLQQPEQHQEALIAGLSEALRSGKRFSISKVLLWLRDLLTTKHTEKATSGEDTSWGGLRNTTARFVKQTLQGQEQPVASMADFPVIFDILRELLLTPSRMSVTPQTAEPRERGERGPNNWEQELLNTTRGMAFMALITAAWWVWRDRKSRGQDKLSLREIDGVEGILRLLLDAQAPLFHAGFGERLWTLVNIDTNWVTEQLKNIFPTAAEQSKLFEAAWQTYLTYGGYYPDEEWFPLLRFAYEHALEQLKGVVADPRAGTANDPAARLGSHLIRLYLGELLDLQPGSPLLCFFDHAPDASCELALSPIIVDVGQLHGGPSDSTDAELLRLLELWSFRRPKLLAAKVERKSEAAAFVELSTSARLSSEQSLQMLEQLLPFADIARWSHQMLKRLASLATEQPAACLRCLTIFFNRNGFPHEEETKAILRAALASADADLQQEARDWANRLVASGYVSFESILPVPAPLPTVEVVGPIKSASEPTVSTTAQPQMLLDRLVVEGFKSLHSLNLELGTFNVFVGANGSGKTNILEALGVLGAATFKEVTPETLMERNVRPARALLYKSSFQAHDLRRLITLAAHGANGVLYQLGLDPADEGGTRWRIFSERLEDKERKILRRNARSCLIFDAEGKSQRIAEPVPTETYASSAASLNPDAKSVRAMMDLLKGFCVFSPSTQVLRGLAEDRARAPLGLGGGGLPSALRELLFPKERRLGAFDIDEILELIGWADDLSVIPSSEAKLSPAIHPQQLVVEFRDRFMKRGRNLLTDYDASEGALYVLFYLALASHAEAPRLCAIDNFDQCIHPRLASRLTQLLSEQLVRDGSRQWLLTTHSPLVLDGLDLRNDRIRLFAVDRTDSGVTQVRRIQVKPELLTDLSKGYSLSRLWLMGRLGGVPEL